MRVFTLVHAVPLQLRVMSLIPCSLEMSAAGVAAARPMLGHHDGRGQPARRLRRLVAELAAAGGACACAAAAAAVQLSSPPAPSPDDPFTNRSANDADPEAASAVLHPLAQEPDGAVAAGELVELLAREQAAAARRDYRLAAQLRDLQVYIIQ
eukprot:SAG22_NODE_142_length_17922_cov_10.990406_2_plen_153_part_00